MAKKSVAMVLATVMAVSMGVAGASTVQADASVTLKLAHADNETSIFHQGATAFKEKVEELSGGNMTVDIFPNGQLGTLADAAAGIQMGTLDIAPVSSTVLANFAPSIAVYDLPFIIENYEHAYKTLDGEVGEALAAELEANGMLCKGWWTMGFRNTTTSKDVESIDDLKGLKIRTQNSEVQMAIFSALGVDPTPMDFSELFTALQQGTVDGQENPYVNILQSNIYEVNDTIVETEHVFQVAGFLVSPKTYEGLTEEQQKIIDEAGAYATEVERKACETDNETAKDTLIDEHGMKLVTLDKAELQERTADVYNDYPDLKDLADKVKAAK